MQNVAFLVDRVRKTYYKGKEILIVDYSDCRGESMIEVYKTAKQIGIQENHSFLLLNIFNNRTYVTSDFMRYIENDFKEVEHLIDKQVVIGLSKIQIWILKGYNLWSSRKLFYFETYNEALEFLVE